ncbi:MAG TPA: tetratricopeptide repeat protein [Woeseiaceae bacterium]|nr:tetratricopeptide repeat protein [Woeseiaceae bacterium]
MSLVAELRRRNVFRVAAAYLVAGWLLAEVLTNVLPVLGAPEWTERAVLIIFALGFIPAVVFSWIYELTPEGLKREDELGEEARPKSRTSRVLDHITLAGVVIIIVSVGLFSARQAGDDEVVAPAEISDASVAVLPFVNMSSDKDNEYFSDGLTETLLHMLAQIPDLKVAARTSSFAFKGQNKTIGEIAMALGVAHVLEGSVQRAGDRVRITAQLIRASDGFHVWSSSYDREFSNIFEIQDEIAQRVGYELSESLLGVGEPQLTSVKTTSPDAYDLYLQARRERATYSYGGLQAAEDLLKGALLIDPDFIEAKTELAASYIQQTETGLMQPAEAFSEILAITGQVLETEPENPVAQAVRVYVESLQRALQGDVQAMPDAVARLKELVAQVPDELQLQLLLVKAYKAAQRPEPAVAVLEKALHDDPYNPEVLYELGTLYGRVERWEDARASIEKSLEIEPKQPNAYSILAGLSLRYGDGVGYVQQILKALEVDPRDHELPGLLAEFLYQLELFEEGDDFRDRVLTIAPTSDLAYRIQLVRADRIGDATAADASARQAILADVSDRRLGFRGAIEYLLRAAVQNGTVEEEMAWLEEQAPGIFDLEADSPPQKIRLAQGMALDAWYVTLPREEVLRRLDVLLERGTAMGIDHAEDPYAQMSVLAMRGEIQAAVQVALDDIFTRPVALNLDWRNVFTQARFEEVVADARVQAALERWEEDEAALRSEVRSYLADLQAAG